MTAVLNVKDLYASFITPGLTVAALQGVSLSVAKGEILGLVGESGSGKTLTGFSINRLISPPGEVVGGQVMLHGEDVLTLSEEKMRKLRGRRIAMIFQDPMMTLNPVLRIETQMRDALRAHEKIGKAEARKRSIAALDEVGIPAPESRLRSYPHELSGGMRQRVAIAIALLHKPDVIIADEPTTALDVTIQGQILSLVQGLCRDRGTALIWITHDLAVVAGIADRLAVMYAGRVVEVGPVDDLLDAPAHPYTRGLIESVPARGQRGKRLNQIPGRMPSLADLPDGCSFAPRCEHATAACAALPDMEAFGPTRSVRCFHPLMERALWAMR
ncbi:ABC transporter ATP-binding protein [Loktanella sp. SALINAS62]|uniref:ABC transporter ATP-binding protein n=1 Tax=Loktanella sp. SALINAS62 TaxID=2706124 RepID=UPI001B8DA522|nr:ABC transporter ATP-binding protein [Loktanella sp. SALINAS62]MBS1301512.1 ABC transporter ATP-binding protein [Loktanella sp. SALINAS62]